MDDISLRTGTAADLEFLYDLLKVALGPYVEQTYGAWDDAAQRRRFAARTRPESHQIVELGGRPVGCLFVQRTPEAVKLNRVFLLPEIQRRGIGTRLVRRVMREARSEGLPVTLRVLKVNPARRLYERLGFDVVGETETHVLMATRSDTAD
jgi:GNAT superfamily N-acetyltransferase